MERVYLQAKVKISDREKVKQLEKEFLEKGVQAIVIPWWAEALKIDKIEDEAELIRYPITEALKEKVRLEQEESKSIYNMEEVHELVKKLPISTEELIDQLECFVSRAENVGVRLDRVDAVRFLNVWYD